MNVIVATPSQVYCSCDWQFTSVDLTTNTTQAGLNHVSYDHPGEDFAITNGYPMEITRVQP